MSVKRVLLCEVNEIFNQLVPDQTSCMFFIFPIQQLKQESSDKPWSSSVRALTDRQTDRQTDGQTDGRTNATNCIISPALRSIIGPGLVSSTGLLVLPKVDKLIHHNIPQILSQLVFPCTMVIDLGECKEALCWWDQNVKPLSLVYTSKRRMPV